MDTKFDFGPQKDDRIVYIRAVDRAELPTEVQEQIEGDTPLYAVHRPDGERLALVQGRRLAFALAREHDFAPVTVH